MRAGLARYQALGIDALMSFRPVGALAHDKVLQGIWLTGELIPEFGAPVAS
ncbi:hypothetical protein OV207_19575 [Corallococcus sp. BB11-1]|uniref:hypothetical protein n=1 Tax=Corallococcus sp. BB11-1 TaxID=2996783 RepID=UPI00226F1B69|nr:hypothetical protein [Corallococcus sp. BB11-1]MCY1033660.1 hypothetical protein [Corallococcus sp. BB11-1]